MLNIREKFPYTELIELSELRHVEVGAGPWRLYIYGKDQKHRGGMWFRVGKAKYPNEEISFARARQFTDAAIVKGLEVRICDGVDNLVFRSENGKVTYGMTFWNEARPDPAAVAVADRLKGKK